MSIGFLQGIGNSAMTKTSSQSSRDVPSIFFFFHVLIDLTIYSKLSFQLIEHLHTRNCVGMKVNKTWLLLSRKHIKDFLGEQKVTDLTN